MNVLHINSYYIGSKLYQRLYRKFDIKGIKQKIYIPVQYQNNIGKNKINNLENGELYYSNIFNTFDRLIYCTKINKAYNDIINKINVSNIDIAHAHSLFTNGGIAYKLYKKYNLKYIVAVRNTDLNIFFKYFLHLRKKGINILKNAHKIIFISSAYKRRLLYNYIPDNLKKEITEKSLVIPNGVNDFWFNNNYNINQGNHQQNINLVYAGKLNKNKNIINSFKAVLKLREKGYSVNFKIIGKGQERDKILNYIEGYDFIELLDFMSRDELIKHYRASDIFIMPSFNETFGLVYIEAMTQGLPIIYTKDEGVDGYFKQGQVGFAVDPNNIDEIAEKILKIKKNYKEISQLCYLLSKTFNWDKIADIYINLYKN